MEERNQCRQFLTFRLEQEIYAADVAQVREILDRIEITRVPQMPAYMLGVINLRGSVLPVVDLRRRFGLAPGEQTRDSCIIVLEVMVAGALTVVGVLADAVREVLELGESQIEPPPRLGMKLESEFICGMGKQGEEFIILLDIDRVFSTEEIRLFNDSGTAREDAA